MLRATLLVVAAAAAAADVASSFVNYGHAVIEDFASPEEIAAMKADMAALEAGYWASNPEGHVFRTDEGQLDAQAKSRYFFDSADRVHFFEEAGEQKKLNKAGHGLHLMDNAFGTYSTSDKVKRLLKTLGYRKPVLPQSMYIFKPSEVGGTVTSHQDATFLRTEPEQTVVGLWLALDDATVDNGCLWLRNASHQEPLRRVFVRDREPHEPDPEMVFVFTPPFRPTNHYFSVPEHDRIEYEHVPWDGKEITLKQAKKREYVPVPVKAGTLVVRGRRPEVIAGTLDHLSLPNRSPDPRHTYQLHVVESDGVEWHVANWLQTQRPEGFLSLSLEEGDRPEL